MNYNLQAAGSKVQSIHTIFEQNPLLMKVSAKKCPALSSLPSKALITKEKRETESVYKLHSVVNKYYMQQDGLVS